MLSSSCTTQYMFALAEAGLLKHSSSHSHIESSRFLLNPHIADVSAGVLIDSLICELNY